jgi:hypothetical protein
VVSVASGHIYKQAFFFTGILGFVWLILFSWLATNSPQKNRFMGDREKRYLKAEVAKYQFKSRKVCAEL